VNSIFQSSARTFFFEKKFSLCVAPASSRRSFPSRREERPLAVAIFHLFAATYDPASVIYTPDAFFSFFHLSFAIGRR